MDDTPYQLHVLAGRVQHPPLTYQTFDEGLAAMEQGLSTGALRTLERDFMGGGSPAESFVLTGPGTVYRLLSRARAMQYANEQAAQIRALRSGLISSRPAPREGAAKILVLRDGGQIEPDLTFESHAAAKEKVAEALETGVLSHRIFADDHLTVQLSPGIMLLLLSEESAERRRRDIVLQALKAQSPPPGIVLPGRKN